MKHIRDQKQDLPKVPECVHTAILTTLNRLEENEDMAKKIRKSRFSGKKFVALAAAMAAVFGMTVIAAAAEFWWNQKAAEEFGNPTPERQQQMVEAGVAEEQTVSSTDAGITVTAVQTLRDANRIYMLFELTAEEAVIDGNSGFSDWKMITDEGKNLWDYERSMTGSGGVTDAQSGTLLTQGFYFWDFLMEEDPEGWNGDTLTVQLTDFEYYTYENGPEGTPHKIEGEWEFTLHLTDTTELARTFTPEKTVMAAGVPVRLNSVTVTPLTVTLHYCLDDVEAAGEAFGGEDYGLIELFATGFVDGDGNRVERMGGSSGARTEDEDIITCGLPSPMDVDTVQAILLGGGDTIELR